MKTAVFSACPYDRRFLEEANARDHSRQGFEFAYFDVALDVSTVGLAQGFDADCAFPSVHRVGLVRRHQMYQSWPTVGSELIPSPTFGDTLGHVGSRWLFGRK